MSFTEPVIIVGAPRSGTSLLQRIVREHPDFVAVARESGIIWDPLCHPANNGWVGEGRPRGSVSEKEIERVRAEFDRYALSSSAWKSVGRSGLLNNRFTGGLIKASYRPLYRAWTWARARLPRNRDASRRLVDKSVHYAFWLDLLDAVFPDARYVHIVREGAKTLDSMIDGWLDPTKFNTYAVPGSLNVDGHAGRHWSFVLPPGWEEYREAPVEEVVAFQWLAVQERILAFRRELAPERFLTVKLEELTSDTESVLRALADHARLPWSEYFDDLVRDLPVVNASRRQPKPGGLRHPDRVERVADRLELVMRELGYPVARTSEAVLR